MPTRELLKSAALGGLLFVLPVVIVVLFAGHVAQLLADHVLRPLANRFQIGPAEATGLVIVAIGAGLLGWATLRRLNRWFWDHCLAHPQAERRASAVREQGGTTRHSATPVLVQDNGRFALGFHVDTLENGLMVVQAPGVRLAKARRILYLPPDQVSPLAPVAGQPSGIEHASGAEPVRLLRSSPPWTQRAALHS